MRGHNETITIWNLYQNPTSGKAEYYRHIVNNCSWSNESGVKTSGTTLAPSNKYKISIAENPLYKNYVEWKKLTSDDMTKYFTINKNDLIARGLWDLEVTTNLNTIKTQTQPFSMTVDNIIDLTQKDRQGRHIEVTGV